MYLPKQKPPSLPGVDAKSVPGFPNHLLRVGRFISEVMNVSALPDLPAKNDLDDVPELIRYAPVSWERCSNENVLGS